MDPLPTPDTDSSDIGPVDERIQRFGASIGRLGDELDWERLGRTYCWKDGESFFGAEDRSRLLDAGLQIATDLAMHLESLPANGPGRSLYVGAGLAELGPMAFEGIVLGRHVCARSLGGDEVEELARAAAVVNSAVAEQLGPGPTLPTIEGRALEQDPPDSPFDHLWFVSVLTDPEAFPALHDKLYDRQKGASELATGRGELSVDRQRAGILVGLALDAIQVPAILTTTDEELPFFEGELAMRGLGLTMSPSARLSPIVGDPLRHGRIESLAKEGQA